jgi:hypothetical protein
LDTQRDVSVPRLRVEIDVRVGSFSEAGAFQIDVRSSPMNGHRAAGIELAAFASAPGKLAAKSSR